MDMQIGDGENSPSPDLLNKCYVKSLSLLARKEYSVDGLKKRLSRYPYSIEIINQVIEKLLSHGHLNENRFVSNLIRHLVKKGKAKFYIESAVKREKIIFDQQLYLEIIKDEQGPRESRIQYLIEKSAKKYIKKAETYHIFQNKVMSTLFRQGILESYESESELRNMLRDIWLKNQREGSNTIPDDII